jgi:ketosteroid isomerase-like protein
MKRSQLVLAGLIVLVGWMPRLARAQGVAGAGRAGIEAFNHALETATRAMDNAATVALWEKDGVTLLPSTKPIRGRPAIAQFMADVTKQLVGARMESFDLKCFDIAVSGAIGSEWCLEHQVVALPNGQPKFDGWGKMLLVLRRDRDGRWRMLREMWNQAIPDSSVTSR